MVFYQGFRCLKQSSLHFPRGTEWWLCMQVWFVFLSQHLNLLQRFLHIFTYFHYIPHAYTISAYIFAGLAILSAYCMANPFKNVVAYLDCFLKCTVNHSKPVESLLHGFSPLYRLYHMPTPTQLTFLKASNTVSLLYGKTLQEPS